MASLRWSHAGMVCSGDFLYKPISLETRQAGILGIEGQFLEVYCIVGFTQLLIMVLVITVHYLFNDAKNEDRERDM